jgi:hypothetical protein
MQKSLSVLIVGLSPREWKRRPHKLQGRPQLIGQELYDAIGFHNQGKADDRATTKKDNSGRMQQRTQCITYYLLLHHFTNFVT